MIAGTLTKLRFVNATSTLSTISLAARVGSFKQYSKMPVDEKVLKTEQEWKSELSREEYRVLREKGTEPAFSGRFDKYYPEIGSGYFACRGCLNPLYSAQSKFDSGCGKLVVFMKSLSFVSPFLLIV